MLIATPGMSVAVMVVMVMMVIMVVGMRLVAIAAGSNDK